MCVLASNEFLQKGFEGRIFITVQYDKNILHETSSSETWRNTQNSMLNRIHRTNSGDPLLLPGEKCFLSQSQIYVDMHWGSGYPADSGQLTADSAYVHLTNQRLILLRNPVSKGSFSSLHFLLTHVHEGKMKQPWFGANMFDFIALPVSPHVSFTSYMLK